MICARCGSPNTTTREAPALGYADRGGVNISVQCHDCQRRSRAFRPPERKRVHAMAVDRVMLATQDALAATVIDGVECHPDDCISYHEPGEHGVYEVGEAYAASNPPDNGTFEVKDIVSGVKFTVDREASDLAVGRIVGKATIPGAAKHVTIDPVAFTTDVPLERVADAVRSTPVHTLAGSRARALREGDNKPLPPLTYYHLCHRGHRWEGELTDTECRECAGDIRIDPTVPCPNCRCTDQ